MQKIKHILVWIEDLYYLCWGTAAKFFVFGVPKHFLSQKKDKCPIIFIPGIFNTWSFMNKLLCKLSYAGHSVYVVPELKNNLFPIEQSAVIVDSFIKKHKIKDAIILAHSKGGLIGKYLLGHYNNSRDIAGMISIATPYHGSSNAIFVPFPAYRELLPKSKVITELQKLKDVNEKIVAISPRIDNVVWSKKGCCLEGAMKNIILNESGHNKILFCDELYEAILQAITIINENI